MNRQNIFNKALKGVVAQGCAARPPSGKGCFYRLNLDTNRQVRCAVGHVLVGLLPESFDAWETDGGTDDLLQNIALNYDGEDNVPDEIYDMLGDEENQTFLDELQMIHDSTSERKSGEAFLPAYTRRMEHFAKENNLDFPPECRLHSIYY